MSVSQSLYTVLNSYNGLKSLIGEGSPVTCRLYHYVMPQNVTLPAVVYQDITSDRMNTIADSGGNGVERYTFQITAWDLTLSSVDAIMTQVLSAMQAATAFESVPYSIRGFFEVETKLYSMQRDFSIWYHF